MILKGSILSPLKVTTQDVVFATLKHILLFKSSFINTNANALRMCVHLLIIVLLHLKLYYLVSYFGDFCLYRHWCQIIVPTNYMYKCLTVIR